MYIYTHTAGYLLGASILLAPCLWDSEEAPCWSQRKVSFTENTFSILTTKINPQSLIPFPHKNHGKFMLSCSLFASSVLNCPRWHVNDVREGLGCSVHSCFQVPIAHSWYTQCICWRSYVASGLLRLPWNPHWVFPTNAQTSNQKRLCKPSSQWAFIGRAHSQTCREEKLWGRRISLWRKSWPENFALWVLWTCWKASDLWLKIFSFILVFLFPIWYFYHLSQSLSLWIYLLGPTAMNYDRNRDNTSHFLEHFAF